MKLYNTLTRQKETFLPLKADEVSIYSCGPTVYNYAHIGNLRTYLFMDFLRRALQREGYTLRHCMNITDVGHLVSDADEGEDKMAKASREQRKTPLEIAEYYTGVFMKDIQALNISVPEFVPKATDNIPQMIDFVLGLQKLGYAYEIDDGIYFDISKFPDYGKLSGLNLEEQQAGARVDVNDQKHHPADFALWKKAESNHIMQWPSPWGMGYPGWHIECSAMSLRYLGERFDIHTGGVDHIPVHHENEIAQSQCLLGHPAASYWIHGEFMLVDGGKMSKSLGNTYTLDQLSQRGYDPLCFRYFCLNAHYRSKLNFTWDGMQSAHKSLENLRLAIHKHQDADGAVDSAVLDQFMAEFETAVADDLNIPKALGIVWNMARFSIKSHALYERILDCDQILALNLNAPPVQADKPLPLDASIEILIEQRQAARKNKDFATADQIRDKLKEMGITLEDTPDGVKWHSAK